MTTTHNRVEADLEQYRRELTGYSYRMLGSTFEAEDAVQEAMVRAWRAIDRFEGRSSLRTWLYRITTNVCLDMLKGRKRRERPMDMGPSRTAEIDNLGPGLPGEVWLEPVPDDRVLTTTADPAEMAVERDSIRLAFVAALQHLPPKQRAVLVLREVLRWKAAEVAELLDTTVASVNSALQRARATLADRDLAGPEPMDEEHEALLARYVDAFERYDIESLTSLLAEDAIMTMPPYDLWLQGPDEISRWLVGPGNGCRDSLLIPTAANGTAGFGQYRPGPEGGFEPWGLQVIEVSAGRIIGINTFLDTARMFPMFGLPLDPLPVDS